ncbi:MAG: ComF family protein [Ignavibacteriae bacterium]|jgi:ComF family protein|nr:ComF family protein [Ignavibacteriota bacterium]NOG96719.1 ComF family protein [Ignavibacteriota bacterium]
MKFFNQILDFFLPRICVTCNFPLNANQKLLCPNCVTQISSPSPEVLQKEYERKFLDDSFVNDFAAAFIFKSEKAIQDVVHSLKYQRRFGSGVWLGKMAGDILQNKILNWQADLILPVPLHTLKKAERGFNQSYFIAKGISKQLGVKTKPGVIKRIKFTETQTHLNSLERKANIRNAFKLKKQKLIKNKSIILIDDVVTTGATINECARILKEGGALKVFALSAALADYQFTSSREPKHQV